MSETVNPFNWNRKKMSKTVFVRKLKKQTDSDLSDDSISSREESKESKKGQRIQQLLNRGEFPLELLKKLDFDRINEEDEDFLDTDRKRKLALDENKLRPKILGVKSALFVSSPQNSVSSQVVQHPI